MPFSQPLPVTPPDPFAIGYPGTPNPVLVDICASITTTSMTRQKVAEGTPFDQPWLLDSEGQPTTDPRVLEHSTPRGSLQLIGLPQAAAHMPHRLSIAEMRDKCSVVPAKAGTQRR